MEKKEKKKLTIDGGFNVNAPYTKVPDGLWYCKQFNHLSTQARCIYMLMLGKWNPYQPEEEFPITYDEIRKITRFGRNKISDCIKQLWTQAWIDIPNKGKYPKNASLYTIRLDRLTKEYPNPRRELAKYLQPPKEV